MEFEIEKGNTYGVNARSMPKGGRNRMSQGRQPESNRSPGARIWPLEQAALESICTEAAALLAKALLADRAAIAYRCGESRLALGGQAGFPHRFSLHFNAPISLTVLEEAALHGRATLSHDARSDQQTKQTLTLQLSSAVSLLCVPFCDPKGRPAGAIYADTSHRVQAFRHNELRLARDFAVWLAARLSGQRDLPAPRRKAYLSRQESAATAAPPAQGTSNDGHDREGDKPGLGAYVSELVGRFERFIFYS
jgi:hypothetical protein